MAKCPECKVIFEHTDVCPLCGSPASENISSGGTPYPGNEKGPSANSNSPGFRLNLWGAVSILSLAPLLLTVSIDIIFTKSLSWSVYPAVVLLCLWLYGTSIFFFKRMALFLVLSTFLITCLMLFFIDLFSDGLSWFFPLALPLVFSLYANFSWAFFIIRKAKRIGFNLVAFIFFVIIAVCLCTDFIINLYFQAEFLFSWSIVILAALLPVGGFFIYLHYILKKSLDFKKIFHF